MRKIAEYASNRGFTNVIVLNENRKEVNGLLLVHLPRGPTAQFRLSNLKLSRDIKVCCSVLCSLSLPGLWDAPFEAMSVQSCGGAVVWSPSWPALSCLSVCGRDRGTRAPHTTSPR